jgi:hypothetical protein
MAWLPRGGAPSLRELEKGARSMMSRATDVRTAAACLLVGGLQPDRLGLE